MIDNRRSQETPETGGTLSSGAHWEPTLIGRIGRIGRIRLIDRSDRSDRSEKAIQCRKGVPTIPGVPYMRLFSITTMKPMLCI